MTGRHLQAADSCTSATAAGLWCTFVQRTTPAIRNPWVHAAFPVCRLHGDLRGSVQKQGLQSSHRASLCRGAVHTWRSPGLHQTGSQWQLPTLRFARETECMQALAQVLKPLVLGPGLEHCGVVPMCVCVHTWGWGGYHCHARRQRGTQIPPHRQMRMHHVPAWQH